MCKDWKDTKNRFFKLVHALRDKNISMNRLIYHQDIVGTKKCRVYFFSRTGTEDWTRLKVDLAMGFEPSEQKLILNEGIRTTRKYMNMNKDYTDVLLKYFC